MILVYRFVVEVVICTPVGARERRLANWTLAVFLWPLTCAVCVPSLTTYVLEVRPQNKLNSGAGGPVTAVEIGSALGTAQFFQYVQLLLIYALLASLISLLNRWTRIALRTRLEEAIAAAVRASAGVASPTAAATESSEIQLEQRTENGAVNGGANGGIAGRQEVSGASSQNAQSEARQNAELEVNASFERRSAAERWEALRVHRLVCLLYLLCWSLNPLGTQLKEDMLLS